jgi:hypothetical protein
MRLLMQSQWTDWLGNRRFRPRAELSLDEREALSHITPQRIRPRTPAILVEREDATQLKACRSRLREIQLVWRYEEVGCALGVQARV